MSGEPLRYGKTEAGLRNPSFVAWGGSGLGRPLGKRCRGKPHGMIANIVGPCGSRASPKRSRFPANSALAASSKPRSLPASADRNR